MGCRRVPCPKCRSNNIKIVEDEFGRCLDCGAKFVLPEIVCSKCGSKNVKIIDEDFGKCLDCGERMVFNNDTADSVVTEKSDTENCKPCMMVAGDTTEPEKEIKKPEAVNCDNCGSSDVDIISDEMAKCRHCGATILLHAKQEMPTVMNNEIHIHASSGDASNVDVGFYAIKKTIEPETFLRKGLIYISKQKETPADIFESEIKPATHSFGSILEVNADVNINYSASIGYDRKETYKQWNNSKNCYEEKTRTVTDWSPFNGTKSGNYTCNRAITKINDAGYTIDYNFERAKNSEQSQNIVNYDKATFEKGTIAPYGETEIEKCKGDAISECISDAERELPGDHKKDFRSSGLATVKKVKEYSVPVYSMEYTYKDGKPRRVNSFGFGSTDNMWGETVDCSTEIEKQTDSAVKLFSILALVFIGLSILSTILFCWVFKLGTNAIVFFCLSVVAFVLYLVKRGLAKKNILQMAMKEKIACLNRLLLSRKMEELSDEEKDCFGDWRKCDEK